MFINGVLTRVNTHHVLNQNEITDTQRISIPFSEWNKFKFVDFRIVGAEVSVKRFDGKLEPIFISLFLFLSIM